MGGQILSKEQILAVQDLRQEDVHVPEWGGSVRVRTLSGKERADFERSVLVIRGDKYTVNPKLMREKLVAASVIGDDGKRLFSEEDVAALSLKSSSAIEKVFRVAQRLSGIGEGDIKEIEADLGQAQDGDSASV